MNILEKKVKCMVICHGIIILLLLSLKVGSWSFECIIIFANLFSKLLKSTFYKEMSKFHLKVQSYMY